MKILFTVGTSKYNFARFFEYANRLLSDFVETGDVVYVQHGFNSPLNLEAKGVVVENFEFVSVEHFASILDEIDQVVTHGAAGTIMQCNQVGVRPLVICRRSSLNEHVDDHQVESALKFSSLDLCKLSVGYHHDTAYLKQNNFVRKKRLSGITLNKYLKML